MIYDFMEQQALQPIYISLLDLKKSSQIIQFTKWDVKHKQYNQNHTITLLEQTSHHISSDAMRTIAPILKYKLFNSFLDISIATMCFSATVFFCHFNFRSSN